MINEIKLLALDLDKTTLQDYFSFSKQNLQALHDIQKQGLKVLFVTGRGLQDAIQFSKVAQIDKHYGYVIAANGAIIWDLQQEKIIKENYFSINEVEEIFKSVVNFKLTCLTFSSKNEIYYTNTRLIWFWFIRLFYLMRKITIFNKIKLENLHDLNLKYYKIVIFGRKSVINKWKKYINIEEREWNTYYKTSTQFFEINPSVNKQTALQWFAKAQKIDKSEIMAVGDGANDLELLKWIGYPVTLKNGTKENKAISLIILPNYKKHAIAYLIKRLNDEKYSPHVTNKTITNQIITNANLTNQQSIANINHQEVSVETKEYITASNMNNNIATKTDHDEKIILTFTNLYKSIENQQILKNINFQVRVGEFITILGPSGCGKTTLLRIIAGFEYPEKGEILFFNKNLLNIPVYKREINTVFQNYALFQHLNVFENIAYGLRVKKINNTIIKDEVIKILKMVHLEDSITKKIDQLSGGQQQRVALARALINKPKILLLDEPLSALDSKLRKQMQIELKKIQQEIGITFIFVTHDQEEALTMSDRIIIMKKGEIKQIGNSEDVYNEPKDRWIAAFIGQSNLIDTGIFIKDKLINFDKQNFETITVGFKEQEPVDIVFRPEDIDILDPNVGFFNGKVTSITFKGIHWEITIATEYRLWLVHTTDHFEINELVSIKWNKEDVHVMAKLTNEE